jgi:hypothetical protein
MGEALGLLNQKEEGSTVEGLRGTSLGHLPGLHRKTWRCPTCSLLT